MPYKDTPNAENLYRPFGDVMYVTHWFGRMQKAGYNYNPLRNSAEKRTKVRHINSVRNLPDWHRRAYKTEYKPYNRLDLNEASDDTVLVSVSGKYLMGFNSYHQIEYAARKQKHKDWRIEIIEPFQSFIYQRQGRKKWILIEMGRGYA